MLLVRPTKSLAKKLKVQLSTSPYAETHFMHEWYANDFRYERANLVIFVNAQTFLPIVLKAAPYQSILERFHLEFLRFLSTQGFDNSIKDIPVTAEFAKTQDRSVIGVMNRFIDDLSYEQYHGDLTPEDTLWMSLKLADGLVGSKYWKSPMDMFAEKIGAPAPVRRSLRLV